MTTHHETRCTYAGAGDAMAVGPVGTVTWQHAAFAIETRRAGFVAVQPCPPSSTGALSRQGMAAGPEREERGTERDTE